MAALQWDRPLVRIAGLPTWGEYDFMQGCRRTERGCTTESVAPVTSASLIEKCCLIANPVAGNPTHYMVEHAFEQKGLDWRFMTFEVDSDRLGDAMRGIRALGFLGVKIGEPFQETAIGHLDELTERAKRCGSVNCLTANGERLVGDNTEGAALVNLLRQHTKLAGQRVMVLGAGRLARAIVTALAESGVAALTLVCRSTAAKQRLCDQLSDVIAIPASVVLIDRLPVALERDVAVLVNATSLSTEHPDAKLPIDAATLSAPLVVADVAYNTSHTWLTRQAAEHGCSIIDGLDLYVEQTALALEQWTGVSPDRAAMREAGEEFLGL